MCQKWILTMIIQSIIFYTMVRCDSKDVYACENEDMFLKFTNICNKIIDCPDESDEKYCGHGQSYQGFWHPFTKEFNSSTTGEEPVTVRRISGRKKCFCVQKNTKWDCYRLTDLPQIMNNKVDDCKNNQDEFVDVIQLYNETRTGSLKLMDFSIIAKYAAVKLKDDPNFRMDNFPGTYLDDQCPGNYHLCYQNCLHERKFHSPHTGTILPNFCTHRRGEYNCEVTTCNMPKLIEQTDLDLSLEVSKLYPIKHFNIILDPFVSFNVVGNSTNEKIRLFTRSSLQLEVSLRKTALFGNMEQFTLKLKPLTNSIVHATVYRNDVHILSAYLRSDDFDQGVARVQTEGNVQLSVVNTSATSVHPTPIFLRANGYSLLLQTKKYNKNNKRTLSLWSDYGITSSDVCPFGFLSIKFQTSSRIEKLWMGPRNKVFVIKGNLLRSEYVADVKKTYFLAPVPQNITVFVYFLDLNVSVVNIQVDNITYQLSNISTTNVIDSIKFTQEPLSIKLMYSPERQSSSHILIIALSSLAFCVLCVSICIYVFRRLYKQASEQSRPESLMLVHKNEYYGEFANAEPQLKVEYPNYYYVEQ